MSESMEKCNEENEVTVGTAILASTVREDHGEKVTCDPRPEGRGKRQKSVKHLTQIM